ncbi:ABC transporter substrate-binding protein [Actinomadura fibrosa]|uniref:ABC transporter substrate-binding protein n=1 Tax=Actinomadura fibrosa TaxID=111802 RepID=A0ABW2XGG2_9ACTN|nr:extracellular solute-binding protein [Actinomadura fibrosa]
MTVRFLAVLLLLVASVSACGSGDEKSVTVLASWTGPEADAFQSVLAQFEKDTGIEVDYTGTRDARAVLASELHNGHPPDTAVLANPGDLRSYAASGALRPVGGGAGSDLTTATGPDGARHPYGIVVKAAVKSLIWYNQAAIGPDLRARLAAQTGWDGFAKAAAEIGPKPWCLGFADTSNSGWPGTDWIEDLILHEAGPGPYDAWASGRLPWTSDEVRRAWQTFGSVIAASGTSDILLTGYGQAGTPMATDAQGCRLDHQGSFITAFYSQAGGSGFDFLPFPGGQAVEIGGDILGMFRDTPSARRLVAYLTTARAQQIWIKRRGSGAFSLNRDVPPGAYPDAVSQRIAQALTSAKVVRFDASDSMPTVMAAAFNHAVLEFVADPGRLDKILTALDKVRRTTTFPS